MTEELRCNVSQKLRSGILRCLHIPSTFPVPMMAIVAISIKQGRLLA